jgi:hypothetical protein
MASIAPGALNLVPLNLVPGTLPLNLVPGT